MTSHHKVLNLLGFQVGWFACVLGAAEGFPWLGPAVVGLLLLGHLTYVPAPRAELKLSLAVGALGWLIDSLQGALGVLTFVESPLGNWISPPWMIAMWVNFAITLHVSMSWLLGRYGMGMLLGSIGGPVAYYAGSQLRAVRLEAGLWPSLVAVAAVWAVAVPLLLLMAKRIEPDVVAA